MTDHKEWRQKEYLLAMKKYSNFHLFPGSSAFCKKKSKAYLRPGRVITRYRINEESSRLSRQEQQFSTSCKKTKPSHLRCMRMPGVTQFTMYQHFATRQTLQAVMTKAHGSNLVACRPNMPRIVLMREKKYIFGLYLLHSTIF